MKSPLPRTTYLFLLLPFIALLGFCYVTFTISSLFSRLFDDFNFEIPVLLMWIRNDPISTYLIGCATFLLAVALTWMVKSTGKRVLISIVFAMLIGTCAIALFALLESAMLSGLTPKSTIQTAPSSSAPGSSISSGP
ncbi:MAG TPA: hypothetical protein VG711_01310 [Phycisphaerales bacterium]|nr:hypothetical protein [Phycisphaerales bacterium]